MNAFCAFCGAALNKPIRDINRARKASLNIYCNRKCSGLGRRSNKTMADKVEEKRLYDISYRKRNLQAIKAKKKVRHLLTYDPEKAAIERKAKMPRHVEYCRNPKYKRWKASYDKKHRAKKNYGPFAEAAMLAIDLNNEIKGRMTNEQISQENGTFNKSQNRRRATSEEKSRGRARQRERRPGHSASYGQ